MRKGLRLIGFIFLLGMISFPCQAGEFLALQEVLQEALERNIEVQDAQERVHALREQVVQRAALEDPEIGLAWWSIPSHPVNIGKAEETWYTLSQKFPLLGKRALRKDKAQWDLRVAEVEAQGVKKEVLSRANQAYYDLFFADQLLEIYHVQVALSQKFSQIAKEKFEVGQAPQQDLIRAQIDLLHLVSAVETLMQERHIAVARLNTLLNRPIDTPRGRPKTPTLPEISWPIEQIQKEALKSTPQVEAAYLRAQRSEAAVTLARREFSPDLMAEISFWDINHAPNRWMTSLKINLPWVNRKSYEARIQEALTEQVRAQWAHQTILNETHLAIETLFARFQNNRRVALLYQGGILPLARLSIEAATIGYETQRSDFLTLIGAQKNLQEMEQVYFRALTDAHKTRAELEAFVGTVLEVSP